MQSGRSKLSEGMMVPTRRRLRGMDGSDHAVAEALLKAMPKAELHMHVEGSLEPEMMFEMARRNGVALRYASSQGVRHAEIFFDPQAHTDRGVPFATAITGIRRALLDGERRLGMSSHLIMCFLRHLSAEEAVGTLRTALPYKGWIVGVGLDSSEVGHPPEDFGAVFEEAGKHGFRKVAHAGEEGPPEYIGQALDVLGAARIDHGVRCLEDPGLVERLRAEQIPLTVCPLSNVRLRLFDSIEVHPVKRMLGEGLRVTLNSDDPAYFGGYVADNYLAVRDGLGFTVDELRKVAENSFRASFLDEDTKGRLLAELGAR